MLQYMPKQRRNCLSQMESKHATKSFANFQTKCSCKSGLVFLTKISMQHPSSSLSRCLLAALTVDWAIAWAMIGEWTNHQLFPPPKSGEWPRFAHVNGLEEGFRYRRPSLVTWARACFEQGALPSLAVLPGAVEVRSMVGDKMFQATHIVDGFQRPCVLHGYGGAKSSMPTSLPELATKGWTVIAAALLGTDGKPPLWTQEGCRPVIGTTIECRLTPCPVSHNEESLLLSMWWPARDLDTLESHKSFLKGFEPKHSPSHAYTLEGLAPTATAPDAILALLRDEGFPLWTLNPPPNRMTPVIETLVCFATMVSAEGASTVADLSLHGLLPDSFPRHAWNLAVGTWFRLGGTQKTSMRHQLYRIPAGQQTLPLLQSVNASPKCLVGFTGEGKEVSVELTNTHLCLGSCTDADVWVAIFLGTWLPYLNLRKSFFFFLIAGCNGSLGYWQSLATRESNKQHQWYCVPKESQVPIHYDLSHHNLCMKERMVHKREKRHNNTRKTKARKHQPTTKTNTHNQTQNHRQHRGET